MTWTVIFCVLLAAICTQVNADENADFVVSTNQYFANLLNERVFSTSKTPYEHKYDLYHEVLGILEELNKDFKNYSDHAGLKVHSEGPFYSEILPCHESLNTALYNQYAESRKRVVNAFYEFEKFSTVIHDIPNKELLKIDLNMTIDACEEKNSTKNSTTKNCEFSKLYEVVSNMEQYFMANDELEAKVAATEEEIEHALKTFHLFSNEEANLFEACLAIYVSQNLTSISIEGTRKPFDQFINSQLDHITDDIEHINTIQKKSLTILDEFRNEGLEDVVYTYQNLTEALNSTLKTLKPRSNKITTCTEYLQQNLYDAFTIAQLKIENIYILFNASLSQNVSIAVQVGKDMKSSLEALKRSKKRLSEKRKSSFFANVIDHVKKVGKYHLSREKIEEYETDLKIKIEKALDVFYQRIFEAYHLHNICLKVSKPEIKPIAKLKSATKKTGDKNGLINDLDNLIERIMNIDIGVLDDNQEHLYDTFNNYYSALLNISSEELRYQKLDHSVFFPCIKISRNKTMSEFFQLIDVNNNEARTKYLTIDTELKTLLDNTENLQSRLIAVDKECLDDKEKTTCTSEKIKEIKTQTDYCIETVEKLDKRAKTLHNFYIGLIDNFRGKINEIIGKVPLCVYNVKD